MATPGWGTVAGVAAKIFDRWTDPRRKREKLLAEKKNLLKPNISIKDSARIVAIDDELKFLQSEIERRSD